MSKKSSLGRGLGSLLEDSDIRTEGSSSINEIEIAKIQANPNQPRTHFDETALKELASSIRELGIIQPITLRLLADGTYQIISGERRFRASQMIGLEKIPAYVRTAADQEMMEMALIENVQREDLNPIEIALSYKRLIEDYALTQERLSERIGKNRATVANYVRLLRLPAEIQMALKGRTMDMGHAKALLAIEEPAAQLHIYEQILTNDLSVRKTEELVRQHTQGESVDTLAHSPKSQKTQEDFSELEKSLSMFFQSNVQLKVDGKGKGSIRIAFRNDEELEQLLEKFDRLK